MEKKHSYEVTLTADAHTNMLTAPPRPTITGGAPSDFGGSDDVWSPEHLLLAAVNLCLRTTFLALTARQPFANLEYRDRIEGEVDKTATGLRFIRIKHHVALKVAEAERDRARQMLDKAAKYCLVANSLAVPVELDAVVD